MSNFAKNVYRRIVVPGALLASAALLGCGSTATEAQPAISDSSGACSFRVEGDTVDKVTDNPASARLSGSTLSLQCEKKSAKSGSTTTFGVVLDASVKAFDGPGEYAFDASAKGGELVYNGNDGFRYAVSHKKGQPKCTFYFTKGIKNPSPGDTVEARFECQSIGGYDPDMAVLSDYPRTVNIYGGTIVAVVTK